VPAQPAEAIALRGEFEWRGRLEREPEALGQLGLEPVDATIGNGVLEARVFAIAAIAEVALDTDHGLGHLEPWSGLQETDHVGDARIGLSARRAWRRGPPPTTRLNPSSVALLEILVVEDGDESEVLREHVDVVLRRHHHAVLNLRGSSAAEDGLFFRRADSFSPSSQIS
jgi:hypothetical protein